jgi:hypothetical protein
MGPCSSSLDASDAQQAARSEVRGLDGRRASREAVEGDLIRPVMGWTFGDKMKGRVYVGPRVFAHREAVVAGDVTVFV